MNSAPRAFLLEDDSKNASGKRIWTLTFDLPGEKVNKFSREVMQEFEALLLDLESKGKSGEIEALILQSGKAGIFIAGADIKLIEGAKTEAEATALSRSGQELLDRWEDLPFPRIVAINGAALGGGCELSLASSHIVMSDSASARIGLPEVMLGVIPGMGGSVRLSARVGYAQALDLILNSKQLDGKRAHKAGLADAVLPEARFHHSVQAWVIKNWETLRRGKGLRRKPALGGMGGLVGTILEATPFGRALIFSQAKKAVLARTKGQYPAALEAIRTIRAVGMPYGAIWKGERRTRAMEREARGFGQCAATDVSKNLIRLFFLTEDVKKRNGVEGSSARATPVHIAGVLGAGTMGGGIAQLFAAKGIIAPMKDLTLDALNLGVQAANGIFKKLLKRRRLSEREYLQKLGHIAPTLSYAPFRGADLVVEAIVENMDVKKKVLADLENHIDDDCIVASNTSSLSISEMQKALKRPERFVGMHFFNPVAKMPLIEVIRGEKSDDRAVIAVFELSKKLGKTPVVVKDAPGFLVNRLLLPYMNEASFLLADGAPIPEVDRALLKFGMPMGPLELIDEVGVDVGAKVSKILHHAFGDRMTPALFLNSVVDAGRLGKKAKKGLYLYTRGKKEHDDSVYSIMGVTPKAGALSAQEMVDRCILPMINEGSRCLQEGVVASASELDLAMIMGTGFPPFRGGLMRYADALGIDEVVSRLKVFEARFGARFAPSEALLARQSEGRSFYA